MYEPEKIKEIFGEEILKYLSNKNRGGVSCEKGNSYENFFAVYYLCLLAKEVIEKHQKIQFSSQVMAFVDDLIIDRQVNNALQHYQLKNKSNVSWGNGLRSISDDFKKQYQLNRSISRDSQLNLVVCDRNLKTALESTVPNAIGAYTQVLFFPFESSLVKIIEQNDSFRQAIEYLCAFDNPAPDKIECVATVVLGAWTSSDKSQVSVIDIEIHFLRRYFTSNYYQN